MALHSLQTLKEMGPQIQWLHSYVTEDKVYCVYLAPDEDSIREHARSAGIPADRVAAVRRLIDPANLKYRARASSTGLGQLVLGSPQTPPPRRAFPPSHPAIPRQAAASGRA